jgi:short-subunit dehydrogenase
VAVVVVTGASAGVGRAVARAFGERGDSVALLAREPERLAAAAKEVEAAGATAVLTVPTDVADWHEVDRAADAAEEALGPIDIWINNAMTSVFAPFTDIEPDEFARVTGVTYLGCVHGTRAALTRMETRDSGRIIQIGSALAYRGIPLQSAYCGAKHAIQGFTESVRTELLHDGSNVTITMVQLPAVNTPQFDWVLSRLPKKAQPVPPIFEPEVVARVVVHATEHYRREYWIGWSAIRTIVAQRLMPDVLDRVLGRTGYASQQTDEPAEPDRPANLWEPVPGDYDAHGRFDAQAKPSSATAIAARARDRLFDATGITRVLDRIADGVAAAIARTS